MECLSQELGCDYVPKVKRKPVFTTPDGIGVLRYQIRIFARF